jgi:serpin B
MHTSSVTRRRFLTLSGAAAEGLFAARFARACPVLDAPPGDGAMKIASAVNAFAADLHARLARDEKGGLFFSPFSISAALAMTSAGARGTTLAEMRKTLRLPPEPHAGFGELIGRLNEPKMLTRGGTEAFPKALDGGPPVVKPVPAYQLSVANAIWAQKDFGWHKEFVELTRRHYGAGIVETDFGESEAARRQINDWVAKETRDRIKELIGPGVITALTRMVLCNAIYFKSQWKTKFDPKATREESFTGGDGTKAGVPMMRLTGEFNYGEVTMFVRRAGEKVQLLELPYTGDALSMLVFLPEDPTGAERLPRWLAGEDFTNQKLTRKKVNVALPRFKAETKYSLKPALIDLGIKAAFGGADFTGMSPSGKELFISHVLHKAFV